MSGFPEPLNFVNPSPLPIGMSSNQIKQGNNNIEKKINSLEIKIMSLENTIMKLIKKIEDTNSQQKTKKNRSRSRSRSKNKSRRNNKTIENIIAKLKEGPYKNMPK